jgi:hypothetical protein
LTPCATLIDYAVVTMDAVGIDAVFMDGYAGHNDQRRILPGHPLPDGVMRHYYPFAKQAVALHPDRFAYTACVDPHDPDPGALVADVRAVPGRLSLRISRKLGPQCSSSEQTA